MKKTITLFVVLILIYLCLDYFMNLYIWKKEEEDLLKNYTDQNGNTIDTGSIVTSSTEATTNKNTIVEGGIKPVNYLEDLGSELVIKDIEGVPYYQYQVSEQLFTEPVGLDITTSKWITYNYYTPVSDTILLSNENFKIAQMSINATEVEKTKVKTLEELSEKYTKIFTIKDDEIYQRNSTTLSSDYPIKYIFVDVLGDNV